MTPIELNSQLRSTAFSFSAAIVSVLAIGAFVSTSWLTGLLYAGFAGLLLLNGYLYKRSENGGAALWLSHLVVAIVILTTLASMMSYPDHAEQWCYLVPLVAFLIYPIQLATIIVAIYSVLVAVALILFYEGPLKVQIFFIYLLCLCMTLAFVYLREIKEQQLKPIRRTDNLTLASTREYLAQDLEKEVQRSEREGTDLSVLAMSLDPNCLEHASPEEQDMLLHQLGRLLHENLRLFDSYYRYEGVDFIIVLPHTSSKEAEIKTSQLRAKVKQSLGTRETSATVSVGFASLNVGDTGESLVANARQALTHARNKGYNQSCNFMDIGGEDPILAG